MQTTRRRNRYRNRGRGGGFARDWKSGLKDGGQCEIHHAIRMFLREETGFVGGKRVVKFLVMISSDGAGL